MLVAIVGVGVVAAVVHGDHSDYRDWREYQDAALRTQIAEKEEQSELEQINEMIAKINERRVYELHQ